MKKSIYGIIVLGVIVFGIFYITKKDISNSGVKVVFADVIVLEKSVSVGTDQKNLKEIDGTTKSVSIGSFLKTGDKGRALIALGKAQTSVDYNSLLQIQDKSDQGSVLNVESGKVWSRVQKLADKGEYHEIKTKNAVASVRGTSFGVYVKGDETTLLVATGTVKFIPLDKKGKEQPQFALYVTEGKKATRIGYGVAKMENITDVDRDQFYIWNIDQEKGIEDAKPDHTKTDLILPKVDYTNIESDVTPPDAPAPTKTSSQGDTSSSGSFYLSSITPSVVDVGSGETVTFNGKGFLNAKTLIINETPISFRIVDDAHITIIAGEELSQGLYDVTIVGTKGEESLLPNAFEVRELGKALNESNVR